MRLSGLKAFLVDFATRCWENGQEVLHSKMEDICDTRAGRVVNGSDVLGITYGVN